MTTGKDPTPVQRRDLDTHHEEADIIIPHLVWIASDASGDSHIKVICDNAESSSC